LSGTAGVPVLACLVAVAAVLVAVLGVHTHALGARPSRGSRPSGTRRTTLEH
jgi:hypothetical protein